MTPLPELHRGNDDPLYNIGVVTRMTNISTATLRAWERRYNFPVARRTAGGHRLYSERDIFSLQWVKQRVDEGMQTAQAINALRYQEQLGKFTVASEPVIETFSPTEEGPVLQKYQHKLLEHLLHLDMQEADHVLGEALAVTSPDELILEVIGPVLAQIGNAWEDQQINIANEHLATNYLRQRLLMWMLSSPPPRPVQPVVLACAPNEWHEGSLLILGSLLRRRRWPIAYLGQAVPLADLATFIREIKLSAVVLVAMTESSAAELIEWPQWLPEVAMSGTPPVGFGGKIFINSHEWRLKIMGTYLGDDFREGLENIERLIRQSLSLSVY